MWVMSGTERGAAAAAVAPALQSCQCFPCLANCEVLAETWLVKTWHDHLDWCKQGNCNLSSTSLLLIQRLLPTVNDPFVQRAHRIQVRRVVCGTPCLLLLQQVSFKRCWWRTGEVGGQWGDECGGGTWAGERQVW